MPRLNTPVSARPEFFDRNPVTQVRSAFASRVEDTAETTDFTYTVPTNKKAFITTVLARMVASIGATSTTSLDRIQAQLVFTQSGGNTVDFVTVEFNSQSFVAGEQDHAETGSGPLGLEGDAVLGRHLFHGDGAGAGRVFMG